MKTTRQWRIEYLQALRRQRKWERRKKAGKALEGVEMARPGRAEAEV